MEQRVWLPLRRLSQMKAILRILGFLGLTLAGFGTLRAVIAQQPAISGVAPSSIISNAAAMDSLERARKLVEQFFEQSANVVCEESVTQTTLGKNGKPNYREESRYQYQLEASTAGGSLKLNESRDARKIAFRDPARTLLVTNGFTSILMIVLPQYEASYQFEGVSEEVADGRMIDEIHYKSVPGGRSPAALQLRGKNYPLPLSGSIWIDKESGAIMRLTAEIDSSMSDLGLKGLTSDIHYALVQFHDPEEAYWMPLSATIDVETPLQHWRNVHRFTGYKRFRATMKIELGKNE
jgi:hypothetical protein